MPRKCLEPYARPIKQAVSIPVIIAGRIISPADAESVLAAGSADFVWGEDAWCYVTDKPKLIAEAARVVKSGGTIAFTDWVEGPAGLTDAEADSARDALVELWGRRFGAKLRA